MLVTSKNNFFQFVIYVYIHGNLNNQWHNLFIFITFSSHLTLWLCPMIHRSGEWWLSVLVRKLIPPEWLTYQRPRLYLRQEICSFCQETPFSRMIPHSKDLGATYFTWGDLHFFCQETSFSRMIPRGTRWYLRQVICSFCQEPSFSRMIPHGSRWYLRHEICSFCQETPFFRMIPHGTSWYLRQVICSSCQETPFSRMIPRGPKLTSGDLQFLSGNSSLSRMIPHRTSWYLRQVICSSCQETPFSRMIPHTRDQRTGFQCRHRVYPSGTFLSIRNIGID
jgi:hypothetical protein